MGDTRTPEVHTEFTRRFQTTTETSVEIRKALTVVYQALEKKGYNPINQIAGYLLSEDPSFITNYNNARAILCGIDRDDLIRELLQVYLLSQ